MSKSAPRPSSIADAQLALLLVIAECLLVLADKAQPDAGQRRARFQRLVDGLAGQ